MAIDRHPSRSGCSSFCLLHDPCPPGIDEALWAIPAAPAGLVLSYAHGARRERSGRDG
jgi:hypothetical protein